VPRTLPTALIPVKNDIADSEPFLALLEIEFESETIYLVKNTEAITYKGQVYQPFFFDIKIQESSKGEVPSVSLAVSNVNRSFQAVLEEYEGGIGAEVTVKIIYHGDLAEDPYDTFIFKVTNVSYDATRVNFTLGVENTWRRFFPANRMRNNFCRFKFKDARCKFSGSNTPMDINYLAGTAFGPGQVITGLTSGATASVSEYYEYAYDSTKKALILTSVSGTFVKGETIQNPAGGTASVINIDICPKAFESCKGRNNLANFGGFPGLGLDVSSVLV